MTTAFLNTSQTVRQPRYTVTLNGTVIADSSRGSIQNQNNYSPDRCTVTLVTSQDSKTGFAWFEAQESIIIEVCVGFLNGDARQSKDSWPVIFKGKVDGYNLHYPTNLIEIEARDFSAAFDVKTSETFSNQTSSEIVKTLASRRGLTADVQDTTTPVGEYYKSEHDKISLGSFHKTTTEWHLLVYLAQQEGFDIWVTGDILHFRQAAKESDTPYLVQCTYDPTGMLISNVNDLRLQRDFTKSKDIKVEVKSWNSKQKTSHVYTAGGGSSGKSGGKSGKGEAGTSPQVYTFVIPGLSAAQAQAEANKHLEYLTKLERCISYSEPGNLDYNVRSLIRVVGTPSDGTYYIDQLSRELSFDGGFTQHVSAKNHPKSSGDGNVG